MKLTWQSSEMVSCLHAAEAWLRAPSRIDPALAGDWVRVHAPGESADEVKLAGQTWHFAVKGGAYEIQTHIEGQDDEEPGWPVKSLAAGRYHYLAIGPKQGTIVRYTIINGRFTGYRLNFDPAWEFIRENYPHAENFVRTEGGPVKITAMDKTVLKILSAFPDTKEYWHPEIILEKMKRKA